MHKYVSVPLWMLAVVAGCGGESKRELAPPPKVAKRVAPPAPAELPRQVSFLIKHYGAEPRTLLRYTSGASTTTTEATMAWSRERYTDNAWQPATHYQLTETWRWEVSPAAEGAVVSGLAVGLVVQQAEAPKGKSRRPRAAVPGTAAASTATATSSTSGRPAAAAKSPREAADSSDSLPGADDAVVGQQNMFAQVLQNRPFHFGYDDRGQITAVVFDDDKLANRTLTQLAISEVLQRWLGYVVPLPEVPVGVGASWEVTTVLRVGPIVVTQIMTYTYLGPQDGRWQFEVTGSRDARRQPHELGELAQGRFTEQTHFRRTWKGTLEVDPAWPWPRTGSAKVSTRAHQRTLLDRAKDTWEGLLSRDVGQWSTREVPAAPPAPTVP